MPVAQTYQVFTIKPQKTIAKYEAPKEVQNLEKLITDFSYQNGYDMIDVFNDLLRYIIHGFSPDAPPLHNWRSNASRTGRSGKCLPNGFRS